MRVRLKWLLLTALSLIIFILLLYFILKPFYSQLELVESLIPKILPEKSEYTDQYITQFKSMSIDGTHYSNINDYIKDKRSLNAQEGVWYTSVQITKLTFYQLFLVAFSTLASIIGLYFILKTHIQSAKTLEQLDKYHSFELKPWPNLEIKKLGMTSEGYFNIEVNIVNNGKTPLFNYVMTFDKIEITDLNSAKGYAFNSLATTSLINMSPINPDMSEKLGFGFSIEPESTKGEERTIANDLLKKSEHCYILIKSNFRYKDSFCENDHHRCIPIQFEARLVLEKEEYPYHSSFDVEQYFLSYETTEEDNGRLDLQHKSIRARNTLLIS